MIQLHRVSLAVIAFSLLGATLAAGAPTITSQPRDKYGNTATILDVHENCALYLTVTATGTGPLTYQWKKGATVVNVAGRLNSAGEPGTNDGAVLDLVPSFLTDAGDYTCVVKDSTGSVTSATIKVAAVDIRQRGVLGVAGVDAKLKVDAAGTGLAYKWYRNTDANGAVVNTKLLTSMAADFGGIATNTLTVKAASPADVGKYFCRVFFQGVSMDGGYQNLGVITSPASTSLSVGEDLNLAVAAAGTSGFDSLNYLWKKDGVAIAAPEGTANPLAVDSVSLADAGDYTCTVGGVFRGAAVTGVTTAAADVFVVNTETGYAFGAVGKSATLTFSPTGAAPAQTYQWYKKEGSTETELNNSAKYAGVTTAVLTVNNVQVGDAIDYFCEVTSHGQTNDAGAKRLIVIPAPDSNTVAEGETAELTVEPVGVDSSVVDQMTFQWKKGTSVLVGQEQQTLSLPNSTNATAGDYVCVVSLAGAGTVTSPVGKIVIVDTEPARKLALEGTYAELAVSASTDMGQSYQWYKMAGVTPNPGTDTLLVNGGKYSGATTKKIKVSGLVTGDAGEYYCVVTSFGVPANSGLRTLVVVPNPPSRTVLAGSAWNLQVLPVGADLSEFTFQWKKGTTVTSETSNVYADASAAFDDATSYSCIVTLTGVGTVTTVAAKVVVVSSAPFVRLAVTGKDATLLTSFAGMGSTFQWSRVVSANPADDVPLANGTDYSGVTTKELKVKLAEVPDAGGYRCRVTTYGETVATEVATLVLLPAPDSKLAAVNTPVSLKIVPAGVPAALLGSVTYQWKKMANIDGEVSDTLSFPNVALADNGSYSCIVTLPGAVPSTVTSLPAKLNVVNTVATTKLVLQGVTATFETPVAGMGQTYQWLKSDGSPVPEAAPFSGTTTKALKITSSTLAEGGYYYCRVSAFGMDVNSGNHRLVVVSPAPSVLIDKGDDLTLEVKSSGAPGPLAYKWFKGTAEQAGETSATLEIDNVQISHAGDYSCLVTLSGVGSLKAATKVAVVDISQANVLVVQGKEAKLTVNTAGTGQTYKWRRVGAPEGVYLSDADAGGAKYAGSATKVLTIKAASNADAGDYVCEVTAYGRVPSAIGERTLEVVSSPESTLVAVGTPLNLEVTSTGAIDPLTYQWKKGTAVQSGAAAAEFEIPSVVLNDAGDYVSVVGGGGAVAVTTNKAVVSVADLTAKTVTVDLGKLATLTAVAKGTGLSYHWYRLVGSAEQEITEPNFTGMLTNALKVSNAQFADSGDYVCRITAAGVAVPLTTQAVTLNIRRAPVLTTISSLPTGIVGRSYSHQIAVDPDPLRQPKSYNATGLPAGLTVNTTTGVISGKPTTAVTNQAVTISATNDVGTSSLSVTLTINALPTYLAGSYAGPLPRSAALNDGLGGVLEMVVASTGAATGKVYLGSVSRAFTGSLELSSTDSATATASATISVPRGTTLPPLTMTFNIGANNLLTDGVLSDGSATINFHGWRNKWGATAAAAYAGLHNFAMGLPTGDSSVGNSAVPQGVGFGSFTVEADGKLILAFSPADGSAGVSYATFIGPDGQIALYSALYTTTPKGSIVAELDIDDKGTATSNDNSLSGTGTWSRPLDPSATQRTYKAGFGPVNLAFEGGRYTPPTLVLGVTSGTNNAALSFEDLGTSRLDPNVNISIQTGNVVTISAPNAASLAFDSTASTPSIMTSTGRYKGKFTLSDDNPTTGTSNPNELSRPCTFVGIIYPKNGVLTGAGFVLVPQLPSSGPPATTPTTSPILSGGAYFEPAP